MALWGAIRHEGATRPPTQPVSGLPGPNLVPFATCPNGDYQRLGFAHRSGSLLTGRAGAFPPRGNRGAHLVPLGVPADENAGEQRVVRARLRAGGGHRAPPSHPAPSACREPLPGAAHPANRAARHGCLWRPRGRAHAYRRRGDRGDVRDAGLADGLGAPSLLRLLLAREVVERFVASPRCVVRLCSRPVGGHPLLLNRQVHLLAKHGHFPRGGDPKTDLVARHRKHGHLDLITDHDALIRLARENQHLASFRRALLTGEPAERFSDYLLEPRYATHNRLR